MEEQMTCGKGLAAHAPLPRKLGELTTSVGDVLELHMETLDLSDEHSRAEQAAYSELVRSHRGIGAELVALANRMTSYRDLAVGRHEEAALSDPMHVAAFRKFVQLEQELVALLRGRLNEDLAMLEEMGDGSVT